MKWIGHRSRCRQRCESDSRSGIALIIVLGMLALLVILGVAFAISMRTERLAARAYLDVVRARNLVDAALADVVANQLRNDLRDVFYPGWLAFPEDQTGGVGNYFLAEQGDSYVPGALLPAARDADVLVWRDIRDPLDDRLYGQYAFMVLNCSGLLDANVIAASNRSYGLHPAEIMFDLENLPEASNATLDALREEIGRFENIPELHHLGISTIADAPPFNRLQYVNHFHVYSRFPPGYGGDGIHGPNTAFRQAYIGGPPRSDAGEWLWDIGHIREVLARRPNLFDDNDARNAAAADDFVNLLIDFADESHIPQNPDGLSFKRVPMINEIVVTNMITIESAGAPDVEFILEIFVDVETWYPFTVPPRDPLPFTVRIDELPEFDLIFPEWAEPLADNLVLVSEPDPFMGTPGNPYVVNRFRYESRITEDIGVLDDDPRLGFRLILPTIDVRVGADVVNRVQASWPLDAFEYGGRLSLNVGEQEFVRPAPGRGVFSANDPRMNFDPSDARIPGGQWEAATISLGRENELTLDGPEDEIRYMYCRQGPFLNAGEVSYLVYDAGKPWRTVRLLADEIPPLDNTHGIASRLTTHTNTLSGKVNVNTHHPPVLAAALRGAPIQRAPGPITQRLSADRALSIGELIYNRIEDHPLGGARNLSDVAGMITVGDVEGIIGDTADAGGKFRAESVLRNSWNLLGTRHNLYTIFLIVRVFPQDFEAETGMDLDAAVVAQQRAIVVLWRDPFVSGPTGSPVNESFVRFFSWVTLRD